MTRRFRRAVALACAALGSALPAAADPPAAEALFQEGVELSARGELDQACQKFEASEALDVAVGTLLRLADCYERTGKLASAWARFREASSLARAQAMPERERIATVRADALNQKMAHLVLVVPATAPPDLEIRLGATSIPRTSWGSALPLDAGTAVIEASAPGYLSFRREVKVPRVDHAEMRVTIPELEPEGYGDASAFASPKPQVVTWPREPERRALVATDCGYAARATGVTLAVAGGAGLATSGVFALLAKRRNDQSRAYCPENPHFCSQRGVNLRKDATKLADAATLAAVAGGSLLAAGLLVYWAAPGPSMEQVRLGVVPDVNGAVRLRVEGVF